MLKRWIWCIDIISSSGCCPPNTGTGTTCTNNSFCISIYKARRITPSTNVNAKIMYCEKMLKTNTANWPGTKYNCLNNRFRQYFYKSTWGQMMRLLLNTSSRITAYEENGSSWRKIYVFSMAVPLLSERHPDSYGRTLFPSIMDALSINTNNPCAWVLLNDQWNLASNWWNYRDNVCSNGGLVLV
jgi:hypothetical protein